MKTMSTRKKNSLTRRILFGLATATICFGSLASPVYAEDTTTVSQTTIAKDGDNALPVLDTTKAALGKISGADNAITVTTGSATANTMNIQQTTGNAVIYWDSFNVGKNSTVNFIQTLNGAANTAAMTLNRITGTSPSLIQGNINSIGSLIFINPNGMLFDSGSVVNAAGIIASTAQLANGDQNFYDNLNFPH